MRLLHTGDWHVGRTIRGRSRRDEFADALDTVVAVATDEGVDAVLIAGDLGDQRAVTPDADALIFDTLIRLGERGTRVVAIPGNHDSAARLAAFAPLLERVGTTVVPRVRPPEDGGTVEIPSRDGSETALVACIPFVAPRRFSDATGLFDDMAKGYVDFDDRMGALLARYETAFRADAVNVVLGHVFIAGAQPGGSERTITIGGDYAVSAARLPATASYIALGHVHKPQKVRGSGAEARYCGSLLQLDFGEKGQKKSVNVVEAHPGKPPKVTQVPLDAGRKLVDVSATLDDLPRVAETVGDAYLRVNLSVDEPVLGIADRVRDALPNALDIRLVVREDDSEPEEDSLRGLSPKEQFLSYYEATHPAPPPDALLGAFDRVYEDVAS